MQKSADQGVHSKVGEFAGEFCALKVVEFAGEF